MLKVCKHCGLPPEDHHDFERKMPERCVCPPDDWGNDVKDICNIFLDSDTEPGRCKFCEHDRDCHK